MRRIAPVLVAAALTVTAAAQGQKIKVSTSSVPVYVTVTDADKRLVPDLVLEDFEILDNLKPQAINVFENKPVPITTVVMLDTSGSMTGNIDFLKEGVEQFLLRLLPEDKAQVGEFNDKIKFHPGELHRQPGSADLPAEERPGFRLPDAAVGRGGRECDAARADGRPQGGGALHRR